MDIDLSLLADNWAFVATAGLVAALMVFLKGAVWTQKRATKPGKARHLFWWGRKTLPMQPPLFGGLIGLIPGLPTPEAVASGAPTVLYFAAAGLFSTWIFSTIKSLAKRQGIDLTIPGELVANGQPSPPAETTHGKPNIEDGPGEEAEQDRSEERRPDSEEEAQPEDDRERWEP